VSAQGGPLGLVLGDHGLFVRALDLWLDPAGVSPVGPETAVFVSHAHAAANATGSRALASPETIALSGALGWTFSEAHPMAWGETIPWAIGSGYGGGTAHLSIAPAGHVLGGSQLVIDHPRGRLVYTGDWSSEPDATRPPGEAVACDELVITSAFGLPIFRFRPMQRVAADIVGWCAARLAEDCTPFVLVQTPGPAQSLAHALANRGLPVVADAAVLRACTAYETIGAPIGAVADCAGVRRGAVVLLRADGRVAERQASKRHAVAYASGWAVLDAALAQKKADVGFVFADHADFDGWLALVSSTGASSVYVTRGQARPLAHELRRRGVNADALALEPIDDRGSS
jgi:putative mRNA 3-end processing factor